jgi:hypothetical protein
LIRLHPIAIRRGPGDSHASVDLSKRFVEPLGAAQHGVLARDHFAPGNRIRGDQLRCEVARAHILGESELDLSGDELLHLVAHTCWNKKPGECRVLL